MAASKPSFSYDLNGLNQAMAGKFDRDDVTDLLVRCRRRCCICYRFCGVKIETDHIDQNGGDGIDNAIPVCFECHAEIHAYNPNHPRGRKYTADELRRRRDDWIELCKEKPELLIQSFPSLDVGPLQALIDELTFNKEVGDHVNVTDVCPFLDTQFQRAIQEGALALLADELKRAVCEAYRTMRLANYQLTVLAPVRYDGGHGPGASALRDAIAVVTQAKPKIEGALESLLQFLGHDRADPVDLAD